jgi:hypothetical protein
MNNNIIYKKYNFQHQKNNIKELISILDTDYRILLPEDYLDYLLEYENFEGFINDEYLSLWSIYELVEVNEANCIFDLDPKTFGIGTNGGGELIALQIESGSWKVVLMPLIGLDNPKEIGTSFSNFLERLDRREKWLKE